MMRKISIVIPVFNEADNLQNLWSELEEVLSAGSFEWEAIFIDDGSFDASLDILKGIAAGDDRMKIIALRRNFGQTAAISAGFSYATGDVIVPLDGDMQNDPRDILTLVNKMDEGFDVVSGWRRNRQDRLISRRIPSMIANRIISRMTGVRLHDYGCSLKAYRREVLEHVNLYGELHRFVPVLASQAGGRVTELVVNHRPRTAGTSKYGIDRTIRVVLDLITVKFLLKYSTRPLQLFGKWGFLSLFFSGFAGLTCLYMKFFEDMNLNRNPLTILSAFFLFNGIQLVFLGLLGELTTRTYHESQNKAIFLVGETVNFPGHGRDS